MPRNVKENNRRWRQNHPDIHREKCRRWRNKHRDHLRKYRREYLASRTKTDVKFKIINRLRKRLYMCVRQNQKSGSALKLLGCSLDDFRIYIESRWEIGMTWENYGKHGWHFDHIMPCAIFDLSKPDHQKRCFHFSNIQPMWANDNWCKHDTVVSDQFNLL